MKTLIIDPYNARDLSVLRLYLEEHGCAEILIPRTGRYFIMPKSAALDDLRVLEHWAAIPPISITINS